MSSYDKVMLENQKILTSLYPGVKDLALKVYEEMYHKHGILMRCTDALRSILDQEKKYAKGRTSPGAIVTWAKPGSSWHNFAAAFDSCFVEINGIRCNPYLEGDSRFEALWGLFGKVCELHGLVWGGTFSDEKVDRPHAQIGLPISTKEALVLFRSGGLEEVFRKFDALSGVKK